MGKISASDKNQVLKPEKKRKYRHIFLHELPSKRLFRHRIYSLLRSKIAYVLQKYSKAQRLMTAGTPLELTIVSRDGAVDI